MNRTTSLILAGLLAATLPAIAAKPAQPGFVVDPATLARSMPTGAHVAIDLRSLDVAVDTEAIARLAKGKGLTVSIADAGSFDYVIDYVVQDAELIEIGGHSAADAKRKITLGIRGDGVTGLIDTPKQTYALGYSNRVQLAGPASSQWMTKELAAEPTGLRIREARKGERPPAPGAEPVAIDLGVLTTLNAGDKVVMQLTGLGAVRVSFEQIRPGENSSTWIGHLSDFGDNYKVMLTYSPGATEGHILTPKGEIDLLGNANGDLYQFDPIAAGYQNKLADGDSCAVVASAPNHAHGIAAGASAAGTAPAAPPTAGAGTATTQTIDVLIYYTPGMVSAYGGADKVATRVDAIIAMANQAYAAGGLGYQIRRVGLDMISLDDQTTNASVISQMNARTGPFDGLNARRDQLGADLVTVIRPFYAQSQGSCGVGYVTGYGGTNLGLYANYGLSVVSDGTDRAGQRYYCDGLALAHELGHNMGLMHDRTTVAQQGGGTGVTPYAFGYAVPGRWGTIMSYTFPHQIKFSNPDDYTCGANERCGLPEGDPASAFNVKALSQSMPLVAGFRPTAGTVQTYGVGGVATINGTPTAGVVINVSGVAAASGTANASLVSCQPSGSNGVFACSAPAGYSFTLTPSYPSAPAGTSITWAPAAQAVSAIAANQSLNFAGKTTATAAYTLSISVTVNGRRTLGVPLYVRLGPTDNPANVSCGIAANTTVECRMPKGYSAKVTPVMPASLLPAGKSGSFAPPSMSVTSIGADASFNFVGTIQ